MTANIIKKVFVIVLAIAIVNLSGISFHNYKFSIASADIHNKYSVQFIMDGKLILFHDQNSIVQNGRTLVPIREIFEKLGYAVGWNEETKTVLLSNDKRNVSITIGGTRFMTNNTTCNLDVPAQIINSRTIIPLRDVLESVGCSVYFNERNNTIKISTKAPEPHRFAMVSFERMGGYSVFEIMSDGGINYAHVIGVLDLESFDMPDCIPEGRRDKQGNVIMEVDRFRLSSSEFDKLKVLISALRQRETIENITQVGPNVYVLVDGIPYKGYYYSFYDNNYPVQFEVSELLDIAYLLIDSLDVQMNKDYWETPKDLIERGILDENGTIKEENKELYIWRYGKD